MAEGRNTPRACPAVIPRVAPAGNTSKFWGATMEDTQISGLELQQHLAMGRVRGAAARQGCREVPCHPVNRDELFDDMF